MLFSDGRQGITLLSEHTIRLIDIHPYATHPIMLLLRPLILTSSSLFSTTFAPR